MTKRRVLWLTVEVGASKIEDAAKQAIELAEQLNQNIQFDFNGVRLVANPLSVASEIVDDYTKRFANATRPN